MGDSSPYGAYPAQNLESSSSLEYPNPENADTTFGYLTSHAVSFALGGIQNSISDDFGLLEPSLQWNHEYAMQPPDLAREFGIDRTRCSFAQSSWLGTFLPYQDSHRRDAQYEPSDGQPSIFATVEFSGAAPYDKFAPQVSPKLPLLDDEASERRFSSDAMQQMNCPFQPCSFKYLGRDTTYRQHLKTAHPFIYKCNECGEARNSIEGLSWHATETGHACFPCTHPDCDKTFSRADTYKRHLREHLDDAKRYPCKYCKKYRGQNGFRRKDHLTQHVRGYHHIGDAQESRTQWFPWIEKGFCPHTGCPESKGGRNVADPVFHRVSDDTKHMKTIHYESEFPCPEPGCDRVGGKGYSRRVDLRKHIGKLHGDADMILEEAE